MDSFGKTKVIRGNQTVFLPVRHSFDKATVIKSAIVFVFTCLQQF
jgi:hypothetical protein